MRPKSALAEPLKITTIDDEIVFIGAGSVSFSMTPLAARVTFARLGKELTALALVPAVSSPLGEALVVLIVEDDLILREVGAAALEDAGYVVIQAADASAALQVLETASVIHLMFTDVQMPGDLDGLELSRMVDGRWPSVQLLVTSGNHKPQPGAVPQKGRFLTKPYLVADLLRLVEELTAN
jgi:CheY-like chemotaxis protein